MHMYVCVCVYIYIYMPIPLSLSLCICICYTYIQRFTISLSLELCRTNTLSRVKLIINPPRLGACEFLMKRLAWRATNRTREAAGGAGGGKQNRPPGAATSRLDEQQLSFPINSFPNNGFQATSFPQHMSFSVETLTSVSSRTSIAITIHSA